MKEPARMKAMQQEVFSYNSSVWENGVEGGKKPVEKIAHPAAPDGGV